MLCKKPFIIGALPCGCGQCLPCRINRRRLWSHRMMLESAVHAGSCFVTLTYTKESIPKGETLDPSQTQLWLKRLRKELSPEKIRYFLVGEYGDKTSRPHYHAALFGLDQITGGGNDGRSGLVQKTWGLGHTFVGDLSPESASYIAGYVTKKMTNKNDERLNGRYPEFARMSNGGGKSMSGGIGNPAVQSIADALSTSTVLDSIVKLNDVPGVLKYGKKAFPLGRYLKGVLREKMGFGSRKSPPGVLQKVELEMRFLLEEALKKPENVNKSIKQIVIDMNYQKGLNSEHRLKIFSQKGSL